MDVAQCLKHWTTDWEEGFLSYQINLKGGGTNFKAKQNKWINK